LRPPGRRSVEEPVYFFLLFFLAFFFSPFLSFFLSFFLLNAHPHLSNGHAYVTPFYPEAATSSPRRGRIGD